MHNKLIYVLEDNPDIAYILEYFLSEQGYQVQTFPTIASCNNAINNLKPDLFLLDIQLPDGNGIELCHQLKTNEKTAAIPVLIMSAGKAPATNKLEAANEFISKPFDLEDVLDRITHYLHPSQQNTPALAT